ncbi:MAG: HK97 gp10 family phage protein [Anaerocolumna sp.]
MSKTDYDFSGLDEIEKALTQIIEHDYPEEFEKMVIDLAFQLSGEVKLNTPVGETGYLRDNWHVGKITKINGEYYIEVYNNTEYAEHVEYGHRNRGGKGFVKGKHMMEISIAKVNSHLPNYLRGWLTDFLNKHKI